MISPLWDSILLLLLVLFCQDVRETIDHHWSGSVFARIRHSGLREWFRSDWLRRYHDRDPAKGIRKWLGIPVGWGPFAAVYDAWHFVKMIEVIGVTVFALHYGAGLSGLALAGYSLLAWGVFGWLHSFVLYGWILTWPKRRW